jgi:lipopolysaccharide/colanic/teichoic acid biosynthesis glycosyltransferase
VAENASRAVSLSNRLNYHLSEIIKRSFDFISSLVGIILLSPFLGLIVLAIRRDSPGPIFFYGRRVGRGGKVYKILKFRTMFEVPESYSGPKVTAFDDPRITPLGHWLRDTKLNELPQLWNVLKGEMSLVGPRPEDPDLAKTWPLEAYKEILSVRPGITSPASVQYHNEETLLSGANLFFTYTQNLVPNKLRLDQLYVRNRSFLLDLDTLLWTFLILIPKIGSHTPPEQLLFVGPFTRLVRRYLNWFAIDLLITFAAIGMAGVAWRVSGPLDVGWPKAIAMAIGLSLLFSLSGAILGTNRISWSKATFADGYDLLPAWILATALANLANEISGIFPTKMVLTASGLALLGYVTVRYRSRLLYTFMNRFMYHWGRERAGRERVLIIGAGIKGQHAVWLLSHPTNAMKYWVVGFVDDDLFHQGMRMYGVDVVGLVNDIPELAKAYDVGVIILADYRRGAAGYSPIVDLCNKTKAKLLVLPDFLTVFNTLSSETSMIPVTGGGAARENDMNCLRCMAKFVSTTTEAPEKPGGEEQR